MADDVQENEDDWNPLRLREDEEMDFFTELALHEAERWIQAVTRKKFEYPEDFRRSLGNGVLLCELLNSLKQGSVKRINKLPGAIAGLDNINVFLAACEKNFGLNKTQLFDPSDLEDLSTRAISDENEYLFKQEVDRRARNVAVTVYWLGKAVADKYKGPTLDASAFGALVHSHGNKDIISENCYKNESTLMKEDNNVSNSTNHRHARDSSYDSLGSYERESESSFDELDSSGNNMPVRSDMREMRRYGSTSSLSMSRDLRLSTASGESTFSDDKHDSLYQSSPDLSQGQVHTRSSSTDSAEGNYGNHSRQSSGSADYPTRRLSSSTTRKASTSAPDPLQFVKLKGADNLALTAKKQIEATKEVNLMRGKIDTAATAVTEEPDWQSNFNNWKTKRRKSSYARLTDDLEEEPEKRQQQQKTFSQIMADKDKRRSLGPMNFYPLEDDDSGIGVKDSNITKSTSKTNQSTPKGKKSKSDVAPWAQGSSGDENNSQSDSETNNSHQSGDTDSVFSDKSTPSKILSDDDSWVKKTNPQTVSNKLSGQVKTPQRPISDSRKAWENNVNESQKKDDKKIRDLPTNSAKKIKSLAESYEQKDKEANAVPVVTRRSEFNRSSLSKSLDLSDHSYSKPFSTFDKKPSSPLSPNAPKALLPKEHRFSHGDDSPQQQNSTLNNANRKFAEKTIKINQKPNNERGFGFFLAGGIEKKQPITVQRVSLGSAADVCEVEAGDELISINGRDVTNLAFAQVQGIVDHSLKRGEIVLKIKRFTDEDGYDSMEDSPVADNKPNNTNNNNNNNDDKVDPQSNRNHYRDMTHTGNFKPTLQLSARSDDQPRLMDQLIEEQKREEANKQQEIRAPSPVHVETFNADISFSTQSVPRREVTPPRREVSPPRHEVAPPQHVITPPQHEVTPPPPQTVTPSRPRSSERNQDFRGPNDVTMTEERPTISVKHTPEPSAPKEASPVVMRRSRQPLVQDSPPPPTPPKSELPQLAKMSDSPGTTQNSDTSGFGPPAALMRWQRPRPKSEYHQSSFTTSSEKPLDKNKRLSSTLPYNTESPFSLGKDYSKDDSMMDKVSHDFMESVSVSKPVESTPNNYQFNDTSRIEEWQQKQDQQRMPEQQSTPSFEVNIRAEDSLTAQSAAPSRKLGQVAAPYEVDLGIPADDPPMSTEERFERDQQRIRLQYEEEKKRARDAEKLKQEQENKTLNSDKFLRDMEAQIQQTKQEVTNQHPSYNEPIRMLGTEQRYSSEPMTIKLPSNSPGRPLIIDPRNQHDDTTDNAIPEYSFRVDLPKNNTAPPLRTLNPPVLTQQEILEQERAKIREEEKRKFEEERQKWKEEQEREMRLQQEKIQQEREDLLREQKRVEQEKAMLEQRSKQDDYSYHTPSNNHLYVSPKSSIGSTGSSPKSPPALDPKYRKVAPPPTAPKPDKGNNKARLTREDLLAMNRKATPLAKPDLQEGADGSGGLSPTTREAPSKGELHSLNAVPKQKFRSSAAWIKDEDVPNGERPFVIGKRSDVIHQRDNSNPSEHWVVREAEKRRLAEKNDRYDNSESVTARAGPTKPSQSSLVSRFRGDIEPQPRSNRYSYPSAHSSVAESCLSPTSRGSSVNAYNRNTEPGVTQFSAKTQPNTYASNPSLSQTLPPSFSFNANVRNQDGSSPMKPPRSLSDESGPVIAVSGKQKCSHCGEELGFGAAMVIESLGLYYHVQCFRCCVCRMPLGNGSEGTDVRVRVNKLHCKNCYSYDEAGLKFSKV